MSGTPSLSIGSLVRRFLGRLRFPQLFVIAAVLFAFDIAIPDAIPLLDEAMLAVLTVLLSQWRRDVPDAPANGGEKPPAKNVTPPA